MVVLDPEHAPDVMSDAALVADAQRGSTEAFAVLYERHHARILRHCRNRIGGNDAADAAQETFLRAWRARDGFGGEALVYPWLRTIATNVCIDTLRRRSRSVPVSEVEVVPVVDEPADLGLLTAQTEAMTEALARLSERHRSVLQLREYEGWTYERIADHEQLDLSAVKSLLWRARQSLRREFLLVSAQGRLSAMAGLLSLGRLRDLVSQVGASSVQLGASGTAAAAATAVAAVAVAVPVLTAAPAPPAPIVVPPPVVVTTVVPAPPITVHRSAGAGTPRSTTLVRVAATPAPATTRGAPAATTTTTAPVASAAGSPSSPAPATTPSSIPISGTDSQRGRPDDRGESSKHERSSAGESAEASAKGKEKEKEKGASSDGGERSARVHDVATTTTTPSTDDGEHHGRGRQGDEDRS